MGITERREREKIERRRAILNCARELVLLQGVHYVSMEDIARKAELSKATVYLYFSSKEILFNEICEDAARVFLEHSKPIDIETSGLMALKSFWRGYVEMFGNFDDMIIIFQVRNFLYPGMPFASLGEKSKSPNADAIIASMKNIIDRCKAEELFDSALDSDMATRLLLSMFSIIVESAARIPHETRKSLAVTEELKNTFQIIIRGFAKEGVDRSCLNI